MIMIVLQVDGDHTIAKYYWYMQRSVCPAILVCVQLVLNQLLIVPIWWHGYKILPILLTATGGKIHLIYLRHMHILLHWLWTKKLTRHAKLSDSFFSFRGVSNEKVNLLCSWAINYWQQILILIEIFESLLLAWKKSICWLWVWINLAWHFKQEQRRII